MTIIARLLFAFVLWVPVAVPAAEPGGLSESLTNPGYHDKPDWFKLSFLDLREDLTEASAAGKRVLLYFYQDGCPYCEKLLEDNFGQREIAQKTQSRFDVIAINMWGDREVVDLEGNEVTEKQFSEQLRVMFTPTLLFLNEQGRVLLRVNGYYFPEKFSAALDYAAGQAEAGTSFRDYYDKRAPQPASGKLHDEAKFLKPPYDLTTQVRRSGRPLLVLFEQKQCKVCDELHLDIFQRAETRAELDKLDVVLLDRWSRAALRTPDGRSTTVREWADTLDIKFAPTLVFFDEDREVFRTEAYLKAFHIQGAMAYTHSGAWREQPSFQRFLQARREELEAQGIKIDLMK